MFPLLPLTRIKFFNLLGLLESLAMWLTTVRSVSFTVLVINLCFYFFSVYIYWACHQFVFLLFSVSFPGWNIESDCITFCSLLLLYLQNFSRVKYVINYKKGFINWESLSKFIVGSMAHFNKGLLELQLHNNLIYQLRKNRIDRFLLDNCY